MEQFTMNNLQSDHRRSVLVLAGGDPGAVLVSEVLARHADLSIVSNIQEMLQRLAESPCDVLVCDWRFPLGTWRDALETVQGIYPELPVIVVHRAGREKEWFETLEAGAFDLVTEAHSEHAVLSLFEHAVATHDARLVRSVA